MLKSTFENIRLTAIACAVPTRERTSAAHYAEHGQEFTERIRKTVAVERFRKSCDKQLSSDLGYAAARGIIEAKRVSANDIGVLIYVTQTPDYPFPSSSCILHKRLGLPKDCVTHDLNDGCPGFVFGAHAACSLLDSLNTKYALLIVGDSCTKTERDISKRVTVPFGDGTGAALFEKRSETAGRTRSSDGAESADTEKAAEPIEFTLCTNGSGYLSIIIPNGGYRARTYTPEEMEDQFKSCKYILMDGVGVFNFSITDVPDQINAFVASQGRNIGYYDCVALHQPNMYIIKQIIKKIGADPAKVPISLTNYGNTSGASIPLTLVHRYGAETGFGINALMSGFGVGLSWGTMSARIAVDDILPMIESDDYFNDPELSTKKYD